MPSFPAHCAYYCFELKNNTIPIKGYGDAWLVYNISVSPAYVLRWFVLQSRLRHALSTSQASTLSASTQLIHQLFYFLDETNYPQLVGLFMPEGTWRRQGEWLTGHAQILQALSKRPTTQRIRHVISNAFLAASEPASATLTAYMTAYRFDNGNPQAGSVTISRPFRLSVVHAKLEVSDGLWRVADLDLVPAFEFAADSAPVATSPP